SVSGRQSQQRNVSPDIRFLVPGSRSRFVWWQRTVQAERHARYVYANTVRSCRFDVQRRFYGFNPISAFYRELLEPALIQHAGLPRRTPRYLSMKAMTVPPAESLAPETCFGFQVSAKSNRGSGSAS